MTKPIVSPTKTLISLVLPFWHFVARVIPPAKGGRGGKVGGECVYVIMSIYDRIRNNKELGGILAPTRPGCVTKTRRSMQSVQDTIELNRLMTHIMSVKTILVCNVQHSDQRARSCNLWCRQAIRLSVAAHAARQQCLSRNRQDQNQIKSELLETQASRPAVHHAHRGRRLEGVAHGLALASCDGVAA